MIDAPSERKAAPTPQRLALAARVAELRRDGLIYVEIARVLGISRGYVATLALDPDGSLQLARRARYQGKCERCGEPTDGSNGRAAAPKRCATCAAEIQHENRRWTREAIIEAIQRWNDEYGRPPTASEWFRATPDWAPAATSVFYRRGRYDAPFATWADAVEAAGFPRPRAGRRARSTGSRSS